MARRRCSVDRTTGEIPLCLGDRQRRRHDAVGVNTAIQSPTGDTLSDLNHQNKFKATKYNSIKSVAKSDTEATCTANLALSGGGSVEYDYRIFKEGGKVKVLITDIRR